MTRRISLLLCLMAGPSAAKFVQEPNNAITITATDSAYQAPDTISPGFTSLRLVNKGTELHMAHLVRIDSGKTVGEFIEAYTNAVRTVGPRPAWATRHGGLAAPPHETSSVVQYLEPGTYAMICLLSHGDGNFANLQKLHFMTGMVGTLVVRAGEPTRAARTPPNATNVIRLVDYAFVMKRPLTAGRHVIRVESRGAMPHEFGMFKLAPGKTAADFTTWARSPQSPAPMVSHSGGVAALAPDLDAYITVELTPGEYVLFCFVTAPDGRPHTEHGMLQQIHID